MLSPRLLITVFLLCATNDIRCSPQDDLRSISQETRDAAAKILRDTYIPPARTRWESVVAAIKIGDSKDEVLAQLRPFNPTTEMGAGGGGSYCQFYRLDDLWSVRCCYQTSDNTLFQRELVEFLKWVWVAPPPHFTGAWITYYPNGQRSHKINYQDGQYAGEFTSFHSNGSKCVVQHYEPSGVEGEETGYFPSGQVMHRGYYKAGKQVGTWTWYAEDGLARSTQDHTK